MIPTSNYRIGNDYVRSPNDPHCYNCEFAEWKDERSFCSKFQTVVEPHPVGDNWKKTTSTGVTIAVK